MAIAVSASDLALTFILLWEQTECANGLFVNLQLCIQWLYKTQGVTMGWTCSSNLGDYIYMRNFGFGRHLGMWWKYIKWVKIKVKVKLTL
jgi:hypothetical protein